MKKNGYTVIELLIVVAAFGIIYFIVANKVSYAFSVDYNKELYDQTIESIEKNAQIYAENNKDLFDENKDIYLTVGELASKNVVISSTEGVVSDPRDPEKNLNDMKVKLSFVDDKITVKVLG